MDTSQMMILGTAAVLHTKAANTLANIDLS